MDDVLKGLDRELLAALCQRYGISRLALFGSAIQGDLGPRSDIDLLVEFLADERVGLRFITIQDGLQRILGRTVDLNTLAFLSPYFRDRVQAEAVVLSDAT